MCLLIVNPFSISWSPFSSRKLFPLVSLSLFHRESISLDTSDKTSSGITSICSTIWEDFEKSWWYFIIQWQQHQHVKFLMRCFSTRVLVLLSNGASAISSSKYFFVLFLRLSPCQLDFSLSFSLLGLESFSGFHLVSEFLVVSFSLTACCECWLPCVKLSLHYENINNVYLWRKMHDKMKVIKWRIKRRVWRSP